MSDAKSTKQKGVPIVIPRELHRLLKVAAAMESKSIREFVEPVLESLVEPGHSKTTQSV